MTETRWFLGSSLFTDPTETAKDFIARKLNHYIFKCNWAGNQLDLNAFTNLLLKNEEVELALAARLGKTYDIQVKWENVKSLMQ